MKYSYKETVRGLKMKVLKKNALLLLGAISALSLTSCTTTPPPESKKCKKGEINQSCRKSNNCQQKKKSLFGGRNKKNGQNCNNQCTNDCNGDNATCFTQSCRTGTYTSN